MPLSRTSTLPGPIHPERDLPLGMPEEGGAEDEERGSPNFGAGAWVRAPWYAEADDVPERQDSMTVVTEDLEAAGDEQVTTAGRTCLCMSLCLRLSMPVIASDHLTVPMIASEHACVCV